MADLSSLKQKINALKAKVEQSSITPVYLGSILDDFITQMESIDMTDMSDDVRTAIANAAAAIKKADQALAASRVATDTASSAAAAVDGIIKKIGASGGIAPLDDSSRVPLKHLPGRVDNVVEFRIIAEGIEPSEGMSHHYSGDDGCIVVFDKTTQCFLLGQPKMGQAETETATESDSGSVIPGGTVDPGGKVDPENPWVVEMIDLSKYNFFRSWMDCVSYGTYTANGRKPEGGKIYICQTENKLYCWNGLSLVQTGEGSGTSGEVLDVEDIPALSAADLDRIIGNTAETNL